MSIRRLSWPKGWALGLQVGVSFLVYAAFLVYTYARFGILYYIAADFRPFYASVQIFLQQGAAKVYDMAVQAQYQERIFAPYLLSLDQPTMPLHNPPVFMLLFLPLYVLPPLAGLALWWLTSGALWTVVCFRLGRTFGFRPWP